MDGTRTTVSPSALHEYTSTARHWTLSTTDQTGHTSLRQLLACLEGLTTLRTLRHDLYGQERRRRLVQHVLDQSSDEGRGCALPLVSAHGIPKCRVWVRYRSVAREKHTRDSADARGGK
jgi:hypothetical protein